VSNDVPCRQRHKRSTSLMNMSNQHERRATNFFLLILKPAGIITLVLKNGISKVNNFKNRGIKIAFKLTCFRPT